MTSFVGFKDVWEEDRVNIKLGPLIGAGNFGEVYKGLWRDRFVVAVKTLKFSDQEKRNVKKEEARKEEFRKELEIMKKLRHEKLVKLWCVCTIGEPVYIVTEYMCNGSLLKYMREGEGMSLNFKEIIDMAAQIACGMRYLEASRCVHRDLAARNILVGERNIVKIADFGFAQMLNSNDKLELSQDESNKFPVKWTAPGLLILFYFKTAFFLSNFLGRTVRIQCSCDQFLGLKEKKFPPIHDRNTENEAAF